MAIRGLFWDESVEHHLLLAFCLSLNISQHYEMYTIVCIFIINKYITFIYIIYITKYIITIQIFDYIVYIYSDIQYLSVKE